MAEQSGRERRDDLERRVSEKERRKVRERAKRTSGEVWFGLGAFGIVGWSVAVPTLICTFLGVWLDVRYPQTFSWTLSGLVLGIAIGCLNAWFWISREREDIIKHREMPEDKEKKDKKEGPL